MERIDGGKRRRRRKKRRREVCVGRWERRQIICLYSLPIPGMLVMKDLGIDVELYISSEVDPDAIKVCVHKLRKV